jgi:hypothetical protein
MDSRLEEGVFGREFGRKTNRPWDVPHLRKDCGRISELKPTAQFIYKE